MPSATVRFDSRSAVQQTRADLAQIRAATPLPIPAWLWDSAWRLLVALGRLRGPETVRAVAAGVYGLSALDLRPDSRLLVLGGPVGLANLLTAQYLGEDGQNAAVGDRESVTVGGGVATLWRRAGGERRPVLAAWEEAEKWTAGDGFDRVLVWRRDAEDVRRALLWAWERMRGAKVVTVGEVAWPPEPLLPNPPPPALTVMALRQLVTSVPVGRLGSERTEDEDTIRIVCDRHLCVRTVLERLLGANANVGLLVRGVDISAVFE